MSGYDVARNRQRSKAGQRWLARKLREAGAMNVRVIGTLGGADVECVVAIPGQAHRINWEWKGGLGGQSLSIAAYEALVQASRSRQHQDILPIAVLRERAGSPHVWVCTTTDVLEKIMRNRPVVLLPLDDLLAGLKPPAETP